MAKAPAALALVGEAARLPYPEEFRRETVELVRSSEESIPQLAQYLGVSAQTLRNWIRQADLDEGRRSDGLTSDDRERLRRLEGENKTLRMEGDLLENGRSAGWRSGGGSERFSRALRPVPAPR